MLRGSFAQPFVLFGILSVATTSVYSTDGDPLVAYKSGDYRKAIPVLRDGCEQTPKNPQLCAALLSSLVYEGQGSALITASGSLLLPLFAGADQSPTKTVRPLTLGIYAVVPCNDPHTAHSKPYTILNGKPPEYCLSRSAIVDQTDVISAEFDKYAYTPDTIKLKLRPDATQRLMDFTGTHIGTKVGEVLDGVLRVVPRIDSRTGELWLSTLSPQEAATVLKAFQDHTVANVPPPPLPAGDSYPDATSVVEGVVTIGPGVSPPVLIHLSSPEYSPEALSAKIQGTVILNVLVRSDGTPDVVGVVRSLHPGLDRQAIQCVRSSYRFRPARKDGRPVSVMVQVEVTFRLPQRGQ